MKPEFLILDVDGVMTTGRFFYSEEGKIFKEFGPHDSDGLKMLRDKIKIMFITADKRGFPITKKRIADDMGYPLEIVSEQERYSYFKKLGLDKTIYIGDGYHDAKILKDCIFGIAPKNARIEAKKAADFITDSNSAEGAVLDAAIEIMKRFFS